MNIRRRLYIAIFIFIFSLVYLGYISLDLSESDMRRYEALIFRTKPFNFKQNSGHVISTQHKVGVNKELLLSSKDGFKKVVIDADSSDLLIVQNQSKKPSMLEKMQEVRSWIVSDSYYLDSDGNRAKNLMHSFPNQVSYQPVQKIQFLEAPQGIYDYEALLFSTDDAYMKQGLVYGHYFDADTNLSELEWEGNAEKAWVHVNSNKPNIKASRLKLRWRTQ